MQEKTHLQVGRPQVVVDLAGSDLAKVVCRLHLDDDPIVDDEIEALTSELHAFVHDSNGQLPRDPMASCQQLAFEGARIEVLEESEAKRVVYFKERLDDGVGPLFLDQAGFRHVWNLRTLFLLAASNQLGQAQS